MTFVDPRGFVFCGAWSRSSIVWSSLAPAEPGRQNQGHTIERERDEEGGRPAEAKVLEQLDGLSSMIDSIVTVNTPEIGDSNTADLGAAYGKSSAGLQGSLDDQLEDVNNSGVYARKGLLSR